MKVNDILRVKGSTLFTVKPDELLASALNAMAEKDIGSLVVMSHGQLVGMLTFREVIQQVVKNGGQVGQTAVLEAMDAQPMTCSSDTDLD
jgi:CBS domain-containing protein